ncbi:MAG: hypothetical protein ACREPP_11340 [Rhodanobacteraceae bacterium]
MNTAPDNQAHDSNVDRELMCRASALYDHACEHIDAGTRAKLAAARRKALAAQDHHPRRVIWLPATGAVAACVLVIGLVWFKPQSGNPSAPQTQAVATSDVELPLDADTQQLDLYQNLDFYQWLAQQPRARANPRGGRQ